MQVEVLLTDVDMPLGCSGFELAHRVHRTWPATEILIMSGRQWPSQGDLPGAAFWPPCPNESIVSHVQSAVERTKRAWHVVENPRPSVEQPAKVLPFPKTA